MRQRGAEFAPGNGIFYYCFMAPKPATRATPQWSVSKAVTWLLAALCALVAVCLFLASTLSFSSLRSAVVSSIPPGYEQRFTPQLYTKILFGMRMLGAILAICGAGLAAFCGPLSSLLTRMWRDVAAAGKELRGAMPQKQDGVLHVAAFLAVLLLAVSLRLAFIGEPIRKDEAYTFLHYASRPLFVGLTYYTPNNHLLNTLLMHWSALAFGESIWAVRLPTVLAGVLVVPAAYAMIRLYHGKNAALLTAALVSASSPMVEYSVNARGYSLGALLFIVMIVMAGVATLRRLAGAWIVLPVLGALALYSVPSMLYGVCGVFLYLLAAAPSDFRRSLWTIASAGVLTVVLYAPVLATVGLKAFTDLSDPTLAPVARDLWLPLFTRQLLLLWQHWNMDLPAVASALVIGGSILALLSLKTLRLPPLAVFLCVAIVVCVTVPLQRLIFFPRHWLYLLPLWMGTGAVGWSLVFRKLRYADWFATLLSVSLAGWMGATVLSANSLRHYGGGRSAEAVVVGMKDHLSGGGQFICSDYFDSSLDFQMRLHGIRYRPSPTGELLIVTPAGQPPERTLELAGIPRAQVLSIRKAAHYEDQDVYLGERGLDLPFTPRGSGEMGAFTR